MSQPLGTKAIKYHRRKVRFIFTIELINALELEKAKGKVDLPAS